MKKSILTTALWLTFGLLAWGCARKQPAPPAVVAPPRVSKDASGASLVKLDGITLRLKPMEKAPDLSRLFPVTVQPAATTARR